MNMPRVNFIQPILDVFSGKDPGQVIWQPRIDFWFAVNKTRGTLPDHLKDFSLLDLYDYCHASIRYFVNPLKHEFQNVQITEHWEDEKTIRRIYETPVGRLTDVHHYDEYKLSSYNSEYRLKTREDFIVYQYMLQHETWSWDQEAYEADIRWVDGRGVPQFYFRRSPIQGLFIENMGFENTIFMMADEPEVVQEYLEIAAAADDAMYEVLCKAPIGILNFGENIDVHMDPPSIWRKYLQPYYNRRVNQLTAAGKSSHIHIDGAMRPLIPLIRESPFPAIEACTPLPQGDVDSGRNQGGPG